MVITYFPNPEDQNKWLFYKSDRDDKHHRDIRENKDGFSFESTPFAEDIILYLIPGIPLNKPLAIGWEEIR